MSEPTVKPMRLTGRQYLLVAATVLAVLVVATWRPLAITFHRVGMNLASSGLTAAMSTNPDELLSQFFDEQAAWDWLGFHRDALVSYETLTHRQYNFVHVPCPSFEAQWIQTQFLARTSTHIGWVSFSCGRRHHGDFIINIWIPPHQAADWDAWHLSLSAPGVVEAATAAESKERADDVPDSSD